MKKRSLISITMVLLMSILSACGNSGNTETGANSGGNAADNASGEPVDITVMVGKEEIARPFEEMVKDYNAEQKKVKVTIIPLAGQNGYEKMNTLYASGNAPTIMSIGQEFDLMKDKLLDLSDQDWVSHSAEGTLDFVTVDGQVRAMPMSVEAFGFIYKKDLLDKAVGGTFDPASIRTQDELKKLFEQIQATGVDPIEITPVDWSLGAHFTNVFMTDQSSDRAVRHQFLETLKAGTADLTNNAVYNGWLDTFDMMMEYNSAKDSPLAAQYDDAPLLLADNKAAMWFMGNWAYPQIKEADPDSDYGFLPVPISNNAADYGNSQISASVSLYWAIDAEQASPEEQAGAKDFLNWMIGSEKGQDYYINQFNFIPAFDNFTTKPSDSLSLSVMDYMNSGNTLEWMNLLYNPDGYPTMGASLQKYLTGQIDRAGLTKEFENYWKTVK